MKKEQFILTVGCFDGYHEGHTRLFRRMKEKYPNGKLVVGVHDDESIFVNKKIETICSTSHRMEKVKSDSNVSDVFLVDSADPTESLKAVVKNLEHRGDLIYMRGNDWTQFPGRDFLEAKGIKLVFLPYTKGISSTSLRKRVDELVNSVFRCIYHQNKYSDEETIQLLEEAVFMPSDVVLRRVYEKAYESGLADFFGEPLVYVSKLLGEAWDSEASQRLIPNFINHMGIDVNDIKRDPKEFASLNEFFSRQINLKNRPMEEDALLVSPCDSQALLYTTLDKSRELYVKGRNYNLEQLLGDRKDLIELVSGGMVLFLRLRPWDNHRCYAPSGGTVGVQYSMQGYLHTVKQGAMTREDITPCTENRRVIIPINDEEGVGSYIMVLVGAPLIGSIKVHPQDGDEIIKGQELGYFRYGGSLIMLLFPPEVVHRSTFPVQMASGATKYCNSLEIIELHENEGEPSDQGHGEGVKRTKKNRNGDEDLEWRINPDKKNFNMETHFNLRQSLVKRAEVEDSSDEEEMSEGVQEDKAAGGKWNLWVFIPCFITMLNIIFGFFSIVASMRSGDTNLAAKFIILGFIADTLDGPAARWLNACSRIGAELDSFADFLSFGIASAALLQVTYGLSTLTAALYAVVACFRLARFNIMQQVPGYHTGFASPFPALIFACMAIIFPSLDIGLVLGTMVAMGVMMNTTFLYWKPTAFKSTFKLSLSYLLHAVTLIPALYSFRYAQVPLLSLSLFYLFSFMLIRS